jgi:hypothetical protein
MVAPTVHTHRLLVIVGREKLKLHDRLGRTGPTNNASLNIAAELLGCSAADFAKSMRERTITAGGKIHSPFFRPHTLSLSLVAPLTAPGMDDV